MPVTPPPRLSQLPPSPAGTARLRRNRKQPVRYPQGEWISDFDQDYLIEDMVTGHESVVGDVRVAGHQQLGGSEDQFGAVVQGEGDGSESDSDEVASILQGGAGPHLVDPVLQAGVDVDDEENSVASTPPVSPRDQGDRINTSVQSVTLTPPSSPNLVLSLTPVAAGDTPVSIQGHLVGSPASSATDLPPSIPVVGQGLGRPQDSQQQSVPSQQSTPPPSQPSQNLPVNLDDLPPYHVVHRQFIPTITHIPKAARSDWTRLYTSVCWRVANNPANLANHILYSMLARVILPAGKAPPHPGKPHRLTRSRRG